MDSRFFGPTSPARPRLPFDPDTAVLGAVLQTEEGPLHDPQLEPRDEAVFLLTAAAEIEHALMVQYLFAAYSLRTQEGHPHRGELEKIQKTLLQISREEMGHLMTVQNLLIALGAPLNFNREHSPYASEIYPFRFKLERVTLDSLAKYVIAESPSKLPNGFPPEDAALLEKLKEDAKRANDGHPVRHVGPIFARLVSLLKDNLKGDDFRLDSAGFQGHFDDWGFEPRRVGDGQRLIISTIEGANVAAFREAARKAAQEIGDQGEAFDATGPGINESESHFERFFQTYKEFLTVSQSTTAPLTWPVVENPNTTVAPEELPGSDRAVEAVMEAHLAKGRITDPRTRAWAHLFNLRYRALLACLSHFLRLDSERYVEDAGPLLGDRTARGFLLIWTFKEMRRLRTLSQQLVRMSTITGDLSATAGPPFELPYTLNLPDRDSERWRTHLDIRRAAGRLVRQIMQNGTDGADPFLTDLLKFDEEDERVIQSQIAGGVIPSESLPRDFQKVVLILEEAVRGFSLSARHESFWDRNSRDRFIEAGFPDVATVVTGPDEAGNFDPETSPLIVRLEGAPAIRMPRNRPPVPQSRIKYIRDWIGRKCPDPAGGLGLEREREPNYDAGPPLVTPSPSPGEPISFAVSIRDLFRAFDREAMLPFGFDLHDHQQVSVVADKILERLEDGTMPCDSAWPPDRIALFRQWRDGGRLP